MISLFKKCFDIKVVYKPSSFTYSYNNFILSVIDNNLGINLISNNAVFTVRPNTISLNIVISLSKDLGLHLTGKHVKI